MGEIIREAQAFDETLYNKLVCNESFSSLLEYYSSLRGISAVIKRKFPLLRLTILPTLRPTLAYLSGILLPKEWIEKLILEPDEYLKYGLPIFAVFKPNYRKNGITVYDACSRFVFQHIDYEHFHFNENGKCICSHYHGDITRKNCVVPILESTWNLFVEYQRFERTGEYTLDSHEHGEEGIENERTKRARIL